MSIREAKSQQLARYTSSKWDDLRDQIYGDVEEKIKDDNRFSDQDWKDIAMKTYRWPHKGKRRELPTEGKGIIAQAVAHHASQYRAPIDEKAQDSMVLSQDKDFNVTATTWAGNKYNRPREDADITFDRNYSFGSLGSPTWANTWSSKRRRGSKDNQIPFYTYKAKAAEEAEKKETVPDPTPTGETPDKPTGFQPSGTLSDIGKIISGDIARAPKPIETGSIDFRPTGGSSFTSEPEDNSGSDFSSGIEAAANYGNRATRDFYDRFLPQIETQAQAEALEGGESLRFHLGRFVGKIPELKDPSKLFEEYAKKI